MRSVEQHFEPDRLPAEQQLANDRWRCASPLVAELKERGVEFVDEIEDHGYGLVTHFKMPGGIKAQLYQPHYNTGFSK